MLHIYLHKAGGLFKTKQLPPSTGRMTERQRCPVFPWIWLQNKVTPQCLQLSPHSVPTDTLQYFSCPSGSTLWIPLVLHRSGKGVWNSVSHVWSGWLVSFTHRRKQWELPKAKCQLNAHWNPREQAQDGRRERIRCEETGLAFPTASCRVSNTHTKKLN